MAKASTVTWADHKRFLALALPLTVISLSTPLLGVVDTAIMGRLPQASYIGGVSIGVLIFNTLYWLLGFLRVSTSGFSAQASGRREKQASSLALFRPLVLALVMGVLMVLFQQPLKAAAFALMSPNETVWAVASMYYDIRVWGAPFALANYVIAGWLMGMARIKLSLYLQVTMNVLNMLLAVYFVAGLGMSADGVATATLIAEVGSAFIGMALIARTGLISMASLSVKSIIDSTALVKMMKVNGDLFIRTACLLAVFNYFAVYGLRYGDTILAANAVLLQLHYVIAYLLSGFSNAATVFVGQAMGEKNALLFVKTVTLTALWGGGMAILLSVSVLFLQGPLIAVFTTLPDVQEIAYQYCYWIAVFPLAAFWGLQLYGIFVGATESAPIRNSMIYSLVVYFFILWFLVPYLQNHGVWLAFIVFSLGRSLFLWPYLPRLSKKITGTAAEAVFGD